MATGVTVYIPAQEMARMNGIIRDIVRYSRRELGSVVKQATVLAIRSAIADTPIAVHNRKKQMRHSRRLPGYRSDKTGALTKKQRYKLGIDGKFWWAQYEIIVEKAAKTKLYARSDERRKKLAIPSNRGAAKAGWWGAMDRYDFARQGILNTLQSVSEDKAGMQTLARKVSDMKVRYELGEVTGTETTNKVKYAPKVAPNSAVNGIAKASNRIANRELKKLGDDIYNKWHRSP